MENKQIISYGIVAIVVMLFVAFFLPSVTGNSLGGVSINDPTYNSATNATVDCSGATSTVVLAASSGRVYVGITASSTDITLCKSASGCVDGTGLTIPPDVIWEQDDGYTGAYSCIGRGDSTSTIGVISN
jgi:hypothetical protein